jgi:ketosteroid isomerase-like protein
MLLIRQHVLSTQHRRPTGAVCAAAAFLVGCAGFGCQSSQGGDHESAIAENRAFSREMIAAIEEKSLERMMARIWHSPDVMFVGPRGETARGWDQIRPIEEQFLASFRSARIEIEDETYTIAGETAVAVLTLSGSLTLADGTVESLRMRLSDVRRREAGKWVAIYNHSHMLEPAQPGRESGRD